METFWRRQGLGLRRVCWRIQRHRSQVRSSWRWRQNVDPRERRFWWHGRRMPMAKFWRPTTQSLRVAYTIRLAAWSPLSFPREGLRSMRMLQLTEFRYSSLFPTNPRLEGTPRLSCEQVDAATMVVTGDTYRMTLNTLYGWITKMELKTSQGWRDFLVERSGPVLKTEAGNQVGPESSEGVTLFSYTFTSTSGYLEFERPTMAGRYLFASVGGLSRIMRSRCLVVQQDDNFAWFHLRLASTGRRLPSGVY